MDASCSRLGPNVAGAARDRTIDSAAGSGGIRVGPPGLRLLCRTGRKVDRLATALPGVNALHPEYPDYDPVTLTAHEQVAGATMSRVCCPVLVCAVTACPDAPVSLMAAAEPADCPAGVTKTSKEVPEAGVVEHWKAQPIFQLADVIVKAGLVQFPDDCVGPTSTRAAAVVVVVDPVDDDVVVVDEPEPDDPDVVVVVEEPPVELPAAVVVVVPDEPGAVVFVELAGGGGV